MQKSNRFQKFFSGLLICCLIISTYSPAYASSPYDFYEEMQMLQGDVLSVKAQGVTRVAVSDPEIADIDDAKANEVLLIGIKPGQTTLFVWDSKGKRTILVRVIAEDISIVRVRLQKLLLSAGIKDVVLSENLYEGKVVLTGSASEVNIERIKQITTPFEDKIINLVEKETINEDLIQIDMQITELSTTLAKQLGVDWNTSMLYSEDNTGNNPGTRDLFKIGDFYRATPLSATINAMIEEGKGKILSKPRLVVVNGKEAKLLVGGEIPIKNTVSNSTGQFQENYEFKEYGITLNITPNIKNGQVDIVLNVEVSDVDSSNAAGDGTPAFTKRTAQTQLLLNDRQTIVLAGLIRKRESETNTRVPLLGKIPVVGMLFRSKSTPVANTDSEVVISLTPTIIKSKKNNQGFNGQVNVENQITTPMVSAFQQSIAGYARLVQEKISSAIVFPLEAQQKGWQGVVKLEVVIKKDGSLKDVYIKQSSGYQVLDENALQTTQTMAPYFVFPAEIQREELSLTIPIMYQSVGVKTK